MGRFMAALYDRSVRVSEEACLRQWRSELLQDLGGTVLEIGAGTGANLPFYPSSVERLVLCEPDRHMSKRLVSSLPAESSWEFEISDATAESLPFPDGSINAVVSTLVLCSVTSLAGAIGEIHRVLQQGGRFVFLEHVAAEARPRRLTWQRRLEPLWKRVSGNCHLTRRTEEAILAGGFEIEHIERESIRKAMPLVRPSIRGWARK